MVAILSLLILLFQDHKKIILLSGDNCSFSCDNRIIYQVSFDHTVESKCVVHDHTDLARQDHCQQHH